MASRTPIKLRPAIIAFSIALAGYGQASGGLSDTSNPVPRQPAELTTTSKSVAIATTPALYAARLGNNRFEASHLELQGSGYTVESGKLIGALGKEEGALILVRAPDGALTAIVSRNGQSGLLQVSANGRETYVPEPQYNWSQDDAVPGSAQDSTSPAPSPASGPVYVDALVGLTQAALEQLDGNPVSYALAQMESINLSLRNSKIDTVLLRLAGVRIYAEDIPVTVAGLGRWQQLLNAQRSTYRHDLNVGYSVGGDAAGWGYAPGYTSVNAVGPSVFKHELGHNVGGSHCNTDGEDNYRFGYDTGDDSVRTNLCGNSIYYYSNPEVTVQGRRIGNARTADMARLWREQAARLAGYSPEYDGLRAIHAGEWSVFVVPASGPLSRPYFVASDPAVGPTKPENSLNKGAKLAVPLKNENGQVMTVVMRGACKSPLNLKVIMNSQSGCNYLNETMLFLEYDKDDNPQLPVGWYNGAVELKLVTPGQPDKKILASISVKS